MELLLFGRDGHVRKLVKGNDEYAYLYMAGSEGSCIEQLHGNRAYEGWSIKGGCSDPGRGGARTIVADGVINGEGGRVVTDKVPR